MSTRHGETIREKGREVLEAELDTLQSLAPSINAAHRKAKEAFMAGLVAEIESARPSTDAEIEAEINRLSDGVWMLTRATRERNARQVIVLQQKLDARKEKAHACF